jgi:hypothetical protein
MAWWLCMIESGSGFYAGILAHRDELTAEMVLPSPAS